MVTAIHPTVGGASDSTRAWDTSVSKGPPPARTSPRQRQYLTSSIDHLVGRHLTRLSIPARAPAAAGLRPRGRRRSVDAEPTIAETRHWSMPSDEMATLTGTVRPQRIIGLVLTVAF